MSPEGAVAGPRRRRARLTGALVAPAVAAVTLMLGGCSSGASDTSSSTTTATTIPMVTEHGGTLTLGIDRPVTGCNPQSASGNTWADHLVLAPVLPSAFVVEPDGQPVLDQAVVQQAELVSTSPETIDYTINPKAEWSDGVPVTADDFVYAWQQQRDADPANQPASTLGYRDIASVKGSNDGRSVQVVFKTPYSDWQMLFNQMTPAHVMERVGWSPPCHSVDPAVDLSAGPFEIQSVGLGTVVLQRNPRWWGTPPNLDRLVVRTATGTAQLYRWLAQGVAQVVQPSTFTEGFLVSVQSLPRAKSKLLPGTGMLQLQFATKGAATADRRVRTAIADAVNRMAMVKSSVAWAGRKFAPAQSYLYALGQPNYPDLPAGERTAFPVRDDQRAVAAGLRDAGYRRGPHGTWQGPGGGTVVLHVVVDAGDDFARQAGAMAIQDLRRAGFLVVPAIAATAEQAGEMLASGRSDLAVLPVDGSTYPTTAVAWYTLSLGPPGTGGSLNWPGLDDPAVNSLLARAAEQLNPDTAQPLYQQVDQDLWRQMPGLPLFTEPDVLAWSDRVTGVQPNPYAAGLLWYSQSWGLLVPQSSTTTTTTTTTTTATNGPGGRTTTSR